MMPAGRKTMYLEWTSSPRTGDSEGDARRLDVDEQPFAVWAVAGARPLVLPVVARRDHSAL